MISNTVEKAEDSLLALFEAVGFYKTNKEFFEENSREFKYEVEITPAGLFITPLGDPYETVLTINDHFDVLHTRRINDDLTYSWVTSVSGVVITVLACEVIDYTGTLAPNQIALNHEIR